MKTINETDFLYQLSDGSEVAVNLSDDVLSITTKDGSEKLVDQEEFDMITKEAKRKQSQQN